MIPNVGTRDTHPVWMDAGDDPMHRAKKKAIGLVE